MGKVAYDQLLKKPVKHTHDPLYMTDSAGSEWKLTIDTDGRVVTTRTVNPVAGNPMGPWLWFTYS